MKYLKKNIMYKNYVFCLETLETLFSLFGLIALIQPCCFIKYTGCVTIKLNGYLDTFTYYTTSNDVYDISNTTELNHYSRVE